jgi:hypothetical protein
MTLRKNNTPFFVLFNFITPTSINAKKMIIGKNIVIGNGGLSYTVDA